MVSEYDAIVAPINLGCQLLAKGKTDYKLAGVLTWGNLYLVENEGVQNNELAAFGEQAVPGMIFKLVKDSNDVMKNAKVTYYNAVSDVQAQVLAEPRASPMPSPRTLLTSSCPSKVKRLLLKQATLAMTRLLITLPIKNPAKSLLLAPLL